MQDVNVQEISRKFVEREVQSEVGNFVEYMLKQDDPTAPITFDDIENLYPDPTNWDAEQCEAWILDNFNKGMIEDLHEYAESYELYEESLIEFVRDNAEAQEVLEWWMVSSWLCEKLSEQGEPVISPNIWGRTTSGQAIFMDDNIQRLALKFAKV